MADQPSAPIILSDADVALAQAPIAGLVLAADTGRVLRGNAAARALLFAPEARTHVLALPPEQSLALLRAAREAALAGRVAWIDLGRGVLEVRAGFLSDGSLLTWLQSTRSSLAERLRPGLDLGLQATGIGLWERDITTADSVWDAQCFALWGRDPTLGPPTRAEGLAQVIEEDRERADAALFGANLRDAPDGVDVRIRVGGWTPDELNPAAPCELRYLNIRSRFVRGASLSSQRLVGVMLDVTATRRSEGAQRALAERLALVTDVTGVGIWSVDMQTGTIEWDAQAAAMVGYRDGLAPPTTAALEPLLHPEDRARIRQRLQVVLEEGGALDDDARVTGFDGRVRWLHVRARPDTTRVPNRLIGVCIDVSRMRSAEQRARATAERLELATAAARLGVWDWQPNQPIEFDAQMCELYDVPPGTRCTFDEWTQKLHADDRAATLRRWHALLHGDRHGDAGVLSFRIVRPDGGTRDLRCEMRVFRDAAGRVVRVLGTHLDVSDLRAAERAAQRTAERLVLATSSARIGIWEFDLATRELTWDTEMFRLFGHEADLEPPLAIWRRALHSEDRARVEQQIAAAIRHGIAYDTEFRVVLPDDTVRWLAARGVVHGRENGRALRLVGVNWDITDAREAEAAVRARETAERANRAKSEFVSRMSHELRTPLNALLGYAQLLEMDPAESPTPTQREHIGRIRAAGWHLLNLINDVLDLSRIESGMAAVAMEVVEIEPLVLDSMAMVAPQAAQRGIRLSHMFADAAARTVWADGTRLKQVLLNLLTNAVKFNRFGGAVLVEIDADGEDGVVVIVRDTGPGIVAKQLETIFDAFSRYRQQSVEPEGSGIGLAISRRLVEQMRGRLEVESEPGEGSAFRVHLRRAVVANLPPPGPEPYSRRLTTREDVRGSVLYIEDHPSNTVLIEHLLHARPNVRLYKAADGATGVLLAAACQPNVVLIDMSLPDVDSLTLLRQLQEQPETKGVTCVAVSARPLPDEMRTTLEAGFAAYWVKPLDACTVLEGIDSLLAHRTEASGDWRYT
ncbi:MAG TPA: PAS domain-containing protein [Burkholderiaceae bacterium]|nr:PAS domain-containing protein [Burkholderiaceae bacterium]